MPHLDSFRLGEARLARLGAEVRTKPRQERAWVLFINPNRFFI